MWAVRSRIQVQRAPSLGAPGVWGLLTAQGWAQECPGGGWTLVRLLQPGQLCWLHLAPLGWVPSTPKELTEHLSSRMLTKSPAVSRQTRAWLSFGEMMCSES